MTPCITTGDIAGIDWAAPSGNGGEQRPLAHCVPLSVCGLRHVPKQYQYLGSIGKRGESDIHDLLSHAKGAHRFCQIG